MACSFFGLPEQQESAAEKYRRALEQKAQKERELGGDRSGGAGGRGRDSGGGVIGQKRKASAAPTEEDLDKLRKREEVKRLQQNRDFLSELTSDAKKVEKHGNNSQPPSRPAGGADASRGPSSKLAARGASGKPQSNGLAKSSTSLASKPGGLKAVNGSKAVNGGKVVNGSKAVNGAKPPSSGNRGVGRCPWCMGKGCARCASSQGGVVASKGSSVPNKAMPKSAGGLSSSRGTAPMRPGGPKAPSNAPRPFLPGSKLPSKSTAATGAPNRMKKADTAGPQRPAIQKGFVRPGVPPPKQVGNRPAASTGGGSFFDRSKPSATSSSAAAARPRPGGGMQHGRGQPFGMAARPNRAERLDGFVVDDDEEEEEDWRSAMRAITKYDPTKYGNDFDDRSMVAGFSDLQAEERRSARLGREADRKAEEEELERQRRKAELKKQLKAKKKQKTLG